MPLAQPEPEQPVEVAVEVPGPLTREQVEESLREALLQSFATSGEGFVAEQALVAFDQRMDNSYARWPLASMAERMLRSVELSLAAAAARYLGLRGGRLALPGLQQALERPELAATCVLALGDLGPIAVGALGSALSKQPLRVSALGQLVRLQTGEAAEMVEQELLRQSDEAELVRLHLQALGALGSAAMPALLRLAEGQVIERGLVIESMASVQGAGGALARLVSLKRARHDEELIFAIIERVQATEMLPWIEERLGVSELRGRALESLASLPGSAPLALLVDLAERGSLAEQELIDTLGDLANQDPQRVQVFAAQLLAEEDALGASELLSLLISSGESAGAGALAVLALGDLLTADQRQWAALAVGELGKARQALILCEALSAGELSERRLIAACLITVFHLLGEEGVFEALGSYPLGAVNEVFEALVEQSTDPKKPQGAVRLFRIARVLNLALPSRNLRIGQSSL